MTPVMCYCEIQGTATDSVSASQFKYLKSDRLTDVRKYFGGDS